MVTEHYQTIFLTITFQLKTYFTLNITFFDLLTVKEGKLINRMIIFKELFLFQSYIFIYFQTFYFEATFTMGYR